LRAERSNPLPPRRMPMGLAEGHLFATPALQ
jgi:hypothetical protein